VRQRRAYAAIREAHEETGYPIELACKLLHAARSAYHKWASGKLSQRAAENERLADTLEKIHEESPDKGYRRLNDDLRHDCGIHVNDKRVLRICRVKDIRSTIKYGSRSCTRHAKNPQYLAENLLDRKFYAEKPNEKWLTDVTEFKWYKGNEIHKLYLSAILDLCDRRIVSYVLSEHNDNPLVFKTFDKAVQANPDVHPLFHSDRGFQYTNRTFHHKLVQAGMTQSMSRVAHCIDNGPMEGFWGILKCEMYYLNHFETYEELVDAVGQFIHYYNYQRRQHRLNCLAPMDYRSLLEAA
jgi:transposase InsO family protein